MTTRGSITRGSVTRGGILRGGVLRSQTASKYALELDLTQLKDTVSGKPISCVYGGTRYDLVNGVQTAFDSETPVVTEKGLRGVGAYQNLFKWSEDLTQSVWVKTRIAVIDSQNIKIISTETNGYMYQNINTTNNFFYTLSANLLSASDANIVFWHYWSASGNPSSAIGDCSVLTRISRVVLGAVSNAYVSFGIRPFLVNKNVTFVKAQVSQKKYPHPYIKSEADSASSTTEAGTATAGEATNGAFLENVPVNFPKLKAALESKGTLTFDWTPAYDKAAVTGELNIVSFDGSTNHIYYDATNGLMKVNDGTNIASVALNAVANTTYSIKITWETGTGLKIWNGATAGSLASFAGSFNVSGDTIFFLNCVELQYLNSLKLLKTSDWS